MKVSTTHYKFENYTNIQRWSSYWHQINEVIKMKPASVLVIGVGDGIVVNTLKMQVENVKTLDYDAEFNPDFVCDVSNVDMAINAEKFDVVLCSQVLEHLEFEKFEDTIKKLANICNIGMILSLPQNKRCLFACKLKLPKIPLINIIIQIPRSNILCDQHYWELDYKTTTRKRVKNILERYFDIENQYYVENNLYHYFYILKKTKAA